MLHVLIIEDETLVAMDLEAMLEMEGATSFSFAHTEDGAVDAALARIPDLITSDVRLVHGTGPGAVTSIIKRHGSIPVMFITATPDD
jgi:CheY-like chemotaxis protein